MDYKKKPLPPIVGKAGFGLLGIGLVLMILAFAVNTQRAFFDYLWMYMFLVSIGVGSLALGDRLVPHAEIKPSQRPGGTFFHARIVHPVTGVAFKGFQIPFWVETIEMMKKAVPEASYISNIGWDVAITNSGPVIVEANTIPGFNTAQYRGFREITNGMGYQPIFDEAVNGKPFTNMLDYEKVLIRL